MRREVDAAVILGKLLERHERRFGHRRLIERPTQTFKTPADLRALTDTLAEAARAGAVKLVFDRDAPHLVEQVILVDPDRLYDFKGGDRVMAQVADARCQCRSAGSKKTMSPGRASSMGPPSRCMTP